jgi:hypothetical protein
MKFKLLGAVLAMIVPAAGLAGAPDDRRIPVLAELFTSEGCSSCPPADSLLMKLDQSQPVEGVEIIVLSEHVDYWNRLGWTDPFSSPQFSARQAAYAHALGADVYTPQLVVNGREQYVGSDARAIQAALAGAASGPQVPVEIVSAQRQGAEAVVTVSAGTGQGDVWVAVADEHDESSVRQGENSGKTLAHVAVVRSLVKVGSINAAGTFQKLVRLPLAAGAKPAGTRIVAFVAASRGPILGASMVPLKP